MSGTLELASALAEMDRDALRALVARRKPLAPGSVTDPIGLAAELLRAESITHAIVPLERRLLSALLELPDVSDADAVAVLTRSGLVGRDAGVPVPLSEVTTAVEEALAAAGISPQSFTGTGRSAQEGVIAGEPETGSGSAAATPAGRPDTSSWFSPALTAVGQAAECLRALTLRPARLNRNGTVAVAAIRALAESTRIDVTEIPEVLEALSSAGLTTHRSDARLLFVSARAPEWLSSNHRDRWIALASTTLSAMPIPLRTTLASSGSDLGAAVDGIAQRFPLLPSATVEAAARYALVAEHLGLSVRGRLSDPAQLLLTGDSTAARQIVVGEMPGFAPGVYVQPDLSVVAPGPLLPSDEASLAALSRPEQIGVATSRRITDLTLAEAFDQGNAPEQTREFLERISLTGIPQPLDYLLKSLATRIGDLVVDEHHGDGGRTRIVVSRPELAETLLVDRALQHLQLHRPDTFDSAFAGSGAHTSSGIELFSRLRAEHVLTALTDARYQPSSRAGQAPAAAIPTAGVGTQSPAPAPGSAGAAQGASRPIVLAASADHSSNPASRPLAASEGDTTRSHTMDTTSASLPAGTSPSGSAAAEPAPAAAAQFPEALAALVDRVYLAARSEPGTGDFTRRLELAMRDRSAVRVTAEARGQLHSFTLLPVSIAGGRLRATDQVGGVERTLPVSMITAVEPA